MVGVIVEVVCHGTERTALRGPTGPAHPGRTDTAHTEFVICDESIVEYPLIVYTDLDVSLCKAIPHSLDCSLSSPGSQ
jgi:hypothetical protein